MKKSGIVLLSVLIILGGYFIVKKYPSKNDTLNEKFQYKTASVSEENNADKNQVNQSITESRQNAITRAVSELTPSVVGINVTAVIQYSYESLFSRNPFWRRLFRPEIFEQEVKELGSGFIISKDGYIITNQHVVEDAKEIIVTLSTGEKYNAEIIGQDKQTDISLLKINGIDFPSAKMGNSEDIIIGEWAIALGNPFGLSQYNNQPSVTVGVISSFDMDFGEIEDGRVYMNMIQTDASINPGNSGGPLANSEGEVIGMNSFIYTKSEGSIGLGFAIPINKVMEIVNDLRQKGQVNRNWATGIEITTDWRYLRRVSAYNQLGYGLLVSKVDKNSSADKAGIEAGDLIVEIDGIKIRRTYDIRQYIKENDLRPGDTVNLKLVRDRKTIETNLTLGTQ